MTADERVPDARAAGSFAIGGDMPVTRLGFGAMRITGEHIWGWPSDPPSAIALLRRLPDLGVDFVDTADSYGPHVSEELIRDALHPYGGIVVATKAGLLRPAPGAGWPPLGHPAYLRQQCELSLRRLGVETLDLFQLHRIDPGVPREEQFGVLRELRDEGKVRHLGLSQVTVEEIEAAGRYFRVATVQNRYNVVDRASDPVLEHCERHGIGFMPWFPLGNGELAQARGSLDRIARRHAATPSQVALAWLLARSGSMLPIPGTSTIAHLEENVGAAAIRLEEADLAELESLAAPR